MDLFEYSAAQSSSTNQPLADKMRPRSLQEFMGQTHLVGEGLLLTRAIENDRIFSMILWGPPGCGKTTLAGIMANETNSHFVHFSAVLAGVKEIRSVIKIAKDQQALYRQRTVLFVDEIHRFNKAQQDAFLHHVESGLITLIGATTENPSFEVIAPLMSRCRVLTLKALADEEIEGIIQTALEDAKRGLGDLGLDLKPEARQYLIRISAGDARMALNNLELAANLVVSNKVPSPTKDATVMISLDDVRSALQEKALLYDKSGDEHYNLISALHKSMRGSDPDAALYWLGRMLEAGEDPLYVARRMVRFAVEDIGNADPHALQMALNAMQAYRFLGSPEGDLALAQAAVYLSTASKSNAIYMAYKKVQATIKDSGPLPTPLHIRNAPTKLMRSLGYGKGYQYAHDHADAYVPQDYLPDRLKKMKFYFPTDRGYEQQIRTRLKKWLEMRRQHESSKIKS